MRPRHTSSMRNLLLLAVLTASSITGGSGASDAGTVVSTPAKRTYHTHHYYAIELRRGSDHAGVDPREVADLLGAELVERVGELPDHYLVRAEKPAARALAGKRDLASLTERELVEHDVPESDDAILKRWAQLKSRSPHTLGLQRREQQLLASLVDVERQVLRRRHKRNVIISPYDTPHLFPQVRAPIPGPQPQPYDSMPLDIFARNLSARRPPPIPAGPGPVMMSEFSIADPIFPEQWHLANDKRIGYDLNLTDVWRQNIKGRGINVALIDDGLDMHSPDLKDNFYEEGSYDFNAHTKLPEPRVSDDQHGTRCAGEIAAVKNDVCGVGVAHEAHVAGLRILSGPISDVDEAAALNYDYNNNHIYSCSWGPPDDGKSMDAPKGLIAKAILNGIHNGRHGKGSIYVFAGGNGGGSDDQCNFDGYTNSIYSMTIAAVDREGKHPYYSEMCSANLAAAWSSGSGDHIHTTDVAWNGKNRCTSSHGGTSAAAPLVAGVVALALQARPDLTWRDVQHIAVHSAIMVSPDDPDWQKTQAGRHYNHKFGYGLIDAYQFVEEAKRHKLVKPQTWFETGNISHPISDQFISHLGVTSTFTVTKEMLEKANFESLEHVTARVWIHHERRGDIDIELTSPHGTKSVLARPRRYDEDTRGFPGWSFMSLKHWDEDPVGTWKLEVFDKATPDKTGNFFGWSMTLWGAAIDPAKAVPWTFPQNSVEAHESLAGEPATTTPAGSTPTKPSKPTEHLPGDHGTAEGENTIDFTNPDKGKPSGAASSSPGASPPLEKPAADTGYLTGLRKNSTWLIVAGGVVIIFLGSLVAFFVLRRNRNRRGGGGGGVGSRSGYEFVPDDEDDVLAMDSLERGSSSRAGRGGAAGAGADRRAKGRLVGSTGESRTKELYDAFGTASEDDEDAEEDDGLGGRRTGYHDGAYHDDDDDDDERSQAHAKRGLDEDEEDGRFTIGGEDEKTPTTAMLFDVGEDEGEGESGHARKKSAGSTEDAASGSGSGSWQDAGQSLVDQKD
ncbi:pheromone processing endoprotease [Tilletia horrida]|nr:pheromone processing endoprotease [Tilletia horrida]